MKNREIPVQKFLRYFYVFCAQAFQNFRYVYFWVLGSILMVGATESIHAWSWIACSLFALFIGILGIAQVVGKIDRALQSVPLTFPEGYGKPKWIVEGPYPAKSETYRFSSGGFTAKEFEPFASQLAVRIGQPVKTIRQPDKTVPVLELVLAHAEVPRLLPFADLPLDSLSQGEFFIGKDRDGLVKVSLANIVHMLVAGQSGGGKTQFIKQLLATFLGTTRYSHVALIDMKKGIDFQSFLDLPNFEIATNYEQAEALLNAVNLLYEERTEYLLKNRKTKWTDFSYSELIKDKALAGKPVGPVIVVVDEMAELTKKAVGNNLGAELQSKVSSIACLARCTGIHLVVGTQRPDAKIVDMQIKDNLQARLCFSVPSVSASNIVLGSMMATTIGKSPGRAVFQFEGDKVLQTPLISSDEVETLLDSKKSWNEANVGARKVLKTVPEMAQVSTPSVIN